MNLLFDRSCFSLDIFFCIFFYLCLVRIKNLVMAATWTEKILMICNRTTNIIHSFFVNYLNKYCIAFEILFEQVIFFAKTVSSLRCHTLGRGENLNLTLSDQIPHTIQARVKFPTQERGWGVVKF